MYDELGQAADPIWLILALAALVKAAYPFFSRWLDHRERRWQYQPPPRRRPPTRRTIVRR